MRLTSKLRMRWRFKHDNSFQENFYNQISRWSGRNIRVNKHSTKSFWICAKCQKQSTFLLERSPNLMLKRLNWTEMRDFECFDRRKVNIERDSAMWYGGNNWKFEKEPSAYINRNLLTLKVFYSHGYLNMSSSAHSKSWKFYLCSIYQKLWHSWHLSRICQLATMHTLSLYFSLPMVLTSLWNRLWQNN